MHKMLNVSNINSETNNFGFWKCLNRCRIRNKMLMNENIRILVQQSLFSVH